ncbi:MAG: hypothetical protein M9907_18515 [Burkholderiaceae bacterium]|nr:hypothetical protein [Burkholderiaceae bacterium]
MNTEAQQQPPCDFARTAFVTSAALGVASPWGPSTALPLFLRQHGDSIRFVRDADSWFVWRGDRWEAGDEWLGMALRSFAVAIAQQLVGSCIAPPGEDVKWTLVEWFTYGNFETELERLLRHRPEVTVQTEHFAGDPISLRKWFIAWVERLPYAVLARSPMLGFDDFRADLHATLQARRAPDAQVAA